jgi:zinc/manganese transport system substrate-binding protein
MKRISIALLALASLLPVVAQGKLNVVATLPDFAAIAREVGSDKVNVTSLAKGTEDAHFVDARPSFIVVLNKADVLLEGGAELETGWLPPLIANARNKKILPGQPGRVVLSRDINLLEVPDAPVDRSMGDVHVAGNPHYWLDPLNGKIIAEQVAQAFQRLDPANAADYQANLRRFNARLDEKIAQWIKVMEPYRGTKVLTYHKSFDYFFERFGMELAGTIEPKPGIEPSPAHINALVPRARESGVKLVIIEPFRPRKTPDHVAKNIGAKLLALPDKVEGHPRVKDYFALFDYNVNEIAGALRSSK